jgi:AcrR family transcriptional regulator
MTIVRMAASLADTVGLHNVTLAAVAEKLGVRTPSLYNHINGLNGLYRELALYGIRELGRRIEKVAVGKSLDDALESIMISYRLFAKERPGLYEATLHAPDPQDEEVQQAAKDLVETILTVLQSYGLQEDEALHIVRGLRSLAHGFVSLEVSGGFGIPLDLDQSYRRSIGIFLRGLHSLKN